MRWDGNLEAHVIDGPQAAEIHRNMIEGNHSGKKPSLKGISQGRHPEAVIH